MDSILEVKNCIKFFYKKGKEKLYAVDDVSFCLKKGEVLGIIGESGCGKSTVAKLVTCLLDCDGGSVFIGGKELSKLKGRKKREVYRKIQMVFQNPVGSFDPKKTLGYGIAESLKNQRSPKLTNAQIEEKVCQTLVQCGLTADYAQKYSNEVSGGECQRAAIARSLIIEPEILICDEATSSLDVTIQKQIMDLLTELKTKNNLSIIFICHNFALVQQFCDWVLVMQGGKIVEEGEPNQIINFPKTPYTKNLVDSVYTME